MNDYFSKLNIDSLAVAAIKQRIDKAEESNWENFLELNMLRLNYDVISHDTKIVNLLKDIGDINRVSIFKTNNNTCYSWHVDSLRSSSINMLIDGFDSMCVFGTQEQHKQYSNLVKLQYEPNRYYLLNVKKHHTVYNFNNQRYVLSLGIPKMSYEDVKQYLVEKDMI